MRQIQQGWEWRQKVVGTSGACTFSLRLVRGSHQHPSRCTTQPLCVPPPGLLPITLTPTSHMTSTMPNSVKLPISLKVDACACMCVCACMQSPSKETGGVSKVRALGHTPHISTHMRPMNRCAQRICKRPPHPPTHTDTVGDIPCLVC